MNGNGEMQALRESSFFLQLGFAMLYDVEHADHEEKSAKRSKARSFSSWTLLACGVIAGIVVMSGLRFAFLKNDDVHYHANFALYVNGQREEFKSFTFYEEVQACSAHGSDDPKIRVHMHNQENHLVHVHDEGATWGAFFANLGFVLGDTVLKTDAGVYTDGQDGNKLTFLLNGQPETVIANRVIHSEDVLLINYGQEDEATRQQRAKDITHDAHEANTKHDPASCSGSHDLTTTERFKKALWL